MAITPKEKELAAVGTDAPAQSNYPPQPSEWVWNTSMNWTTLAR
jgi:hypothetical protein